MKLQCKLTMFDKDAGILLTHLVSYKNMTEIAIDSTSIIRFLGDSFQP